MLLCYDEMFFKDLYFRFVMYIVVGYCNSSGMNLVIFKLKN